MRRPGGYVQIISPTETVVQFDRFRCEKISAGVYEADTFRCVHCGNQVHVKAMMPMDQFGSMCRNCMKMVCPTCADGPCVPFEKRLDQIEKRSIALRSYGL